MARKSLPIFLMTMNRIFFISVDDFLHEQIRGAYTATTSKERLAELCEAWELDRSRNILIDLRSATIRFSPNDVRPHVEAVLNSGLGRNRQVAIVYCPQRGFDAVRFFEFLLAKSNVMDLKVFEDYEEALGWLSTARKIEVGGKSETD